MGENQHTNLENMTVAKVVVWVAQGALAAFMVGSASIGILSAFFEWPISNDPMVAGFRLIIALFVAAIIVAVVALIASLVNPIGGFNE